MQIGILEAGAPPAPLQAEHGTYDAMAARLIGGGHAYRSFRVFDGHFPDSIAGFDAFVVTGSANGVMDGASWIDELAEFLRLARGATRLVGICFGHQIMAQAFGGEVVRAPQGWGLGLTCYTIGERAEWMDGPGTVTGTASHQDQVVRLPPHCRVLAASAFTAYAILAYDEHPSISFQFHPEFEPGFSRALFEMRRAPNLSDDLRARAVASLSDANDNARVGGWIRRFLAATRVQRRS